MVYSKEWETAKEHQKQAQTFRSEGRIIELPMAHEGKKKKKKIM